MVSLGFKISSGLELFIEYLVGFEMDVSLVYFVYTRFNNFNINVVFKSSLLLPHIAALTFYLL